MLERLIEVMGDVPAGASVYLACSGGRDSLALAYACVLLYRAKKIEQLPILLHVNHNLQVLNQVWADQVKNFADQHALTCHILSVKVDGNNEKMARTARYQAFFDKMNHGDAILLAHHANDQAETLLMRLANGTGLYGLNGIKPVQNKTWHQKNIILLRPWLSVTRDEITQFCHHHKLKYVDDPTNDTKSNVRGLLRQEVVPSLININPRAVENFAKSAKHLQQITTFVEDAIWQALQQASMHGHQYCHKLNIASIMQVHHAIRPLVLQRFIQQEENLPCQERLVLDIGRLIDRSDNDHESRLFWRGDEHAYVFVRYDGVLYRYRADFWAALQGAFVIEGDCFVSQIDPKIWLAMPDEMQNPKDLVRVDKHQKIQINQHLLSGKKLYQTLRIMPWLRSHLWRDAEGRLVSLGESWQ